MKGLSVKSIPGTECGADFFPAEKWRENVQPGVHNDSS